MTQACPLRVGLVLVDIQGDFLDRPGLEPPRSVLVKSAAWLLEACRARGLPVFHVQTITSPDGVNAMPHWQRAGVSACVAGTPGAAAPPEVAPLPGEVVVEKRFFDGFSEPQLERELARAELDVVIVGGLYLQSCVRATVLGAYTRGYEVWLAGDAVGTAEVGHAELSRDHLGARAAVVLTSGQIVARLDQPPGSPSWTPEPHIHSDPARLEVPLFAIGDSASSEITAVALRAKEAQRKWATVPAEARAEVLSEYARALRERRSELVRQLVVDVGKPIIDAEDEVTRTIAHVEAACDLCPAEYQVITAGVVAETVPAGVVAAITPWNNPVALAAANVAAALACGDGVVLKPAIPGTLIARELVAAARSCLPTEFQWLVGLVEGGADTARALIRERNIDAVALTGSAATGRVAATWCAEALKPFRAELGGNNAAIVLADADVAAAAPLLARAAFSFSGQRCTATRRLIVERACVDEFARAFVDATEALALGDPAERSTVLGPLISVSHRARVRDAIDEAVAEGATIRLPARIPHGLDHGAWLSPAVLVADPRSRIVQEETFGPVAIILVADDRDHAFMLANDVPQGLVATLVSDDPDARRVFLAEMEAGILQIGAGPLPIHPAAPFSGWKNSGLGPPEHGRWDAELFRRTRAVYGESLP